MTNEERLKLLDKHNLCHKCEKAKQFPNRKFCAECLEKIQLDNIKRYDSAKAHEYQVRRSNLRITAVLKYCKYKGIPMTCKHIKEQRKTSIDNVISADQFKRLTTGLKSDGNERWYYHILLLGKTGMRISEALRVTKKDILAGKVTMPAKAHLRTIYFPKSLKDELIPYLEDFGLNDVVMKNRTGEPLTSRGVSSALQSFGKKYGIPKEVMHAHSFRHFFAIEFLKRNNNISLLADLLGHSNVNVTQIYLRQSQEQQQTAIDEAVNW